MTETETTTGYEPYELHPLELCTDCLVLTANGETEGVGQDCYWAGLPRDHVHDDGCWNPDDDETARREAAYLESVEQCWPSAQWSVNPGCPGCEWCRECPTCHECEGYHPDPDDGPCCPGPVGGWEAGETDRADYCPNDEGHFSWSACDCCGSSLGGTRYPGAAVYVGHLAR